jgi:hypothetical protein
MLVIVKRPSIPEVFDRLAFVLDRLVRRAVGAEDARDLQCEILGADAAAERAGAADDDRLRNAQPDLPGRHHCGHVGRPDAGRERA